MLLGVTAIVYFYAGKYNFGEKSLSCGRLTMNKNVNPYFDLRQELHIYKYVCREKMNCKERKELKKNNKEHMYTTYAQWREYVEKKFGSYSKKELEEFPPHLFCL